MIDLRTHFASIVAGSDHQLSWAEPERWIQSELFQQLKEKEIESKVNPLPIEIPYYTRVRSTGRENLVGEASYGKWIDRLTVDEKLRNWHWLELKVVHMINHKLPLNAVKPFVNDTASLERQTRELDDRKK